MPAKFLRPWEVLELDIQDLKQESQDGNRYLLVVADRASKFVFAYPLSSKDAVGVSRKLLEVLLTFVVPLWIRSDARGEFTVQVVEHLCQWLRVSIDYCSAGMPVHSWTRLRLSSIVWNIEGDWTLLWRTSSKPSERYVKPWRKGKLPKTEAGKAIMTA